MFVIIFTHLRPLAEVDKLREAHFAHIDRHYADGLFLLSGRREPRNGAVILAGGESREAVEAAVSSDPFIAAGVASCEIVAFLPGRASEGLRFLLPHGGAA